MSLLKKKKINIAIIGHGFVGKATDWGFNRNVRKFIVDPKQKTSVNDLKDFDPEFIFICVPTPMGEDGSQDSSIVSNVLQELTLIKPSAVKIIKSTVIPSTLNDLMHIDSDIIYNPEFLREKNANEDFANSSMIVLGGNRNIADKVSQLYKNHSRCISSEFIFTDIMTASLIKYSINTFLATKVIFFNELYNLHKKQGTDEDWQRIIKAISNDKRIGSSHMDVPGHDGRLGFGGACFPKDSLAFVKYGKSLGSSLSILEQVIKTNNKIRSKYADLDGREAEQNVSFKDKV